jgi:hypothetical protein
VQERFRGCVGNLSLVRDAAVIQNAKFLEQPDVLKGAGDAPLGDRMRRFAYQLLTAKPDAALRGAIDAGD